MYKDKNDYWQAINRYTSTLDIYKKIKKLDLKYDTSMVYFNLAECNFKVN